MLKLRCSGRSQWKCPLNACVCLPCLESTKSKSWDINLGTYVQQKERVSKATQGRKHEEQKKEEALRPSRKAWSGVSPVYQWESRVSQMLPLDLATRKSLGAKTVQGGKDNRLFLKQSRDSITNILKDPGSKSSRSLSEVKVNFI